MNQTSPHIHLFGNVGKFYFYDVNKNKIVKIAKDTYDILKSEVNNEIIENNTVLNKLSKDGFLSNNRVEKITHPASSILENILNNKVLKICLQLTQQCNFRCDYCVYSGEYENRGHSNKQMSWNIAKKAIDFLIRNSKDLTEANIAFYGGEPLLQYDIICKCIQYANKVSEGKELSFSITTNGSLLTPEIAEYLIKNNTTITVSLDGPKEIQNKNRKFASDDSGTFDKVYNNLIKIFEKNPEFKEHFQISMVVDPTIDVNLLTDFINSDNKLFDKLGINTSFISSAYRKSEIKSNSEFMAKWQYKRFLYFLYLLKKIESSNEMKLLNSSSNDLLKFISNLNKSYGNLAKENHHSGPCIPGQARLFVNCKGEFFPCERVNENSEVMKIGNVDSGFDIENIRNLLNIGKLTSEECKNCYAFRYCYICASAADDGNKLSKAKKLKKCSEVRYNFEYMLKDACTLRELGFKGDLLHLVSDL